MSIRILTKNAVDNTNIDGARQNHFNAGMQSGIVKGALNEGNFFAITSNEIALDTCELRLCGHQVVIDDLQALTLLNKPTQPTKYSMIAEISVSDTSIPTFKLFIQPESTALIQDNLFKSASGRGIYQLRIGNFTLGTTGLISDVVRTVDVITGGGEGASIEVEFNATAEQLASTSQPEAHIDYNEETKKYDVHFGIPAGKGTNVLIGGVGQENWSADFVEEEKLKSKTNGAITHNGDNPVVFAESERQKSETDGVIVHKKQLEENTTEILEQVNKQLENYVEESDLSENVNTLVSQSLTSNFSSTSANKYGNYIIPKEKVLYSNSSGVSISTSYTNVFTHTESLIGKKLAIWYGFYNNQKKKFVCHLGDSLRFISDVLQQSEGTHLTCANFKISSDDNKILQAYGYKVKISDGSIAGCGIKVFDVREIIE